MITTPTRRPLFAAALALCLLVAACSSSTTSSTPSPTSPTPRASSSSTAETGTSAASSAPVPPAAATTIVIKNFGFTVSGPAKTGSTVKVTNNDAEAHTVTADSGAAFDITIKPGKTATFTAPAAARAYKFHCSFHSNMHGALIVTK